MRLLYAVLILLLALMTPAQCQSRFVDVPLPQYAEKIGPSGDPSALPELSHQIVTLTLYVRDGSASGPIIPGAQVIGQDGSGNTFHLTTDSNGYVTIEGDPGTWSFTASADGYKTEPWDQDVTETCTKHAFLQEEQQQESSVITAQDSESIIGEWLLSYNSNNDDSRCGKIPQNYFRMNIYHNGTLYIPEGGISGKWDQSGDVIHIQFVWEVEYIYEGRIDASIRNMEGTYSSWGETDCWWAEKIGT